MAIPSYLHPNPVLRWMAWRRVEELARLLARNLSAPGDDRRVVLDFGCGAGVLFAESSQFADKVYGIDRDSVFLTGLSMGGWGVNHYGFLDEGRG